MRTWVMLLVLAVGVVTYAQDSKPFEARFAIGTSPESQITETVDSTFQFYKRTNKPVYSLEISNQVLESFKFSVILAYHLVPFEVLNGNIQEEYGNYYKTFIGFRGRYEYLQKDDYSVYSGLGLGYTYLFKRGRIPNVPGLASNKSYKEDRELIIQPNVTLLLIGGEYQFNDNLKFYSELNLGSPYVVCLGIGYIL
jgi:hypothetical protein